jgi:hypothetical protein
MSFHLVQGPVKTGIQKGTTARAPGRKPVLPASTECAFPELQLIKQFPILRLGRYKGGLIVDNRNVRELPFKMLAARTIGYQREVKPVGIEASFDKELQGIGGKRLMQKISGGTGFRSTTKTKLNPRMETTSSPHWMSTSRMWRNMLWKNTSGNTMQIMVVPC